ncbi:MAG: LicD family protein [Hungatella sp.]|nr:LicD family protein [Hungatella sp.]
MSGINPSFFKKEIRSDFLVDEKRKKVWAVELEMLERFDQVCKKHGLTYWAFYGTLLGAVRHQGFVPWDDDIDLVMFRDDYERLKAVASWEFREPYFFQDAYTDRRIWALSKIRDSRTTGIEFRELRDFHQGIFIDIFPLDSVADGACEEFDGVRETQGLLWGLVVNPGGTLIELKQELMEGKRGVEELQVFLEIAKKDIRERFRVFEDFNLAHFGETEDLNYITYDLVPCDYKSVRRDWFQETWYLPFEHLMVPVPREYDKILTRCYGDYHRLVRGGTAHESVILDPEISYDEYFARYL